MFPHPAHPDQLLLPFHSQPRLKKTNKGFYIFSLMDAHAQARFSRTHKKEILWFYFCLSNYPPNHPIFYLPVSNSGFKLNDEAQKQGRINDTIAPSRPKN